MNEQFSGWFRRQLTRRQWSQREFARVAKIAPSTVNNWFRGERLPDPASCEAIAEAFGLTLDIVLEVAGHRPAVEPLDPDDPRELLAARVRRMRPDPHDLATLNSILDVYDKRNKEERERRKG